MIVQKLAKLFSRWREPFVYEVARKDVAKVGTVDVAELAGDDRARAVLESVLDHLLSPAMSLASAQDERVTMLLLDRHAALDNGVGYRFQ